MTIKGYWKSARVVAVVAVGSVTTLVLLPIAVNVGTGGTAPGFLARFQGWLWPGVGVLTALTVVLGAWERLRDRAVPHLPVKWNHPANRAAALAQVERWARQRREGSLAVRVLLELDLTAEPGMVVRPVDWVDDPDAAPGVGYSSDEVAALFEDKRHELLVLGAPGAGKSTLLLDLCLALAARAREDPDRPIPVVVDLASWSTAERRFAGQLTPPQDFTTWLVTQLHRRYRVPPDLGRAWLRDRKLALLLDGLDEVADVDRERCVEEVNAMRATHGVQIAVSCRVKDYETLKTRLELYDAVRIDPLTKDRVVDYFDRMGAAMDGVRAALEDSPGLWELLDTPLVLNIMALTYRPGRPVAGGAGEGTPAEQHRRLFDAYVVEMLVRKRPAVPPFGDEQVIRALRFLARLASSPLWNDVVARGRLTRRQAWLPFVRPDLLVGLVAWFVPGLLAGVVGAATALVGARYGVVPALVVGVAAPLLLVALHLRGWWDLPTGPAPRRGWAFLAAGVVAGALSAGPALVVVGMAERVAVAWPAWSVFALVLLGTSVVAYALHWAMGRDPEGLLGVAAALVPLAVMIRTGPSPELVGGIAAGVFFGAVLAVVGSTCVALWSPGYDAYDSRGWVVRASAVVAGGSAAGLLVAWLVGPPVGAAVLGPVTGLVIGLATMPPWTVDEFPFDATADGLAEVLARPLTTSELPWRRAAVLRYATERILLVRVGSEHRFVHRLVRDHLARCDPAALARSVRERLAGG
ncbi:NACHT domain-containing protein [Saccharothrix sp. NPDC042600]|uniref:NACHT domain-containing protein n=1 Tax=Saccharothrix TaxID=2071 RepID=UPI0033EED1C1|nr:hypothetical protein GCM10017745_58940 [Saccharothrix mutabilis subsp. capreolus]